MDGVCERIEVASVELRGALAALFYFANVSSSSCPSSFWPGFFNKTMNELTVENFDTLEQRVYAIAENVLTDASHFLVSVSVRGVRGSRVVEVFIDGDEGIGVDALVSYSREISFMLDTEDFIDGRYKLDVSSPGADRPLEQLRQYKKHIDRKLKVKYEHAEGSKTQEGVLSAVGDDYVELSFANKESRQIAFSDIIESKVLLPW